MVADCLNGGLCILSWLLQVTLYRFLLFYCCLNKVFYCFLRTMDRLYHGCYYKNAEAQTELLLLGKIACYERTSAFGKCSVT